MRARRVPAHAGNPPSTEHLFPLGNILEGIGARVQRKNGRVGDEVPEPGLCPSITRRGVTIRGPAEVRQDERGRFSHGIRIPCESVVDIGRTLYDEALGGKQLDDGRCSIDEGMPRIGVAAHPDERQHSASGQGSPPASLGRNHHHDVRKSGGSVMVATRGDRARRQHWRTIRRDEPAAASESAPKMHPAPPRIRKNPRFLGGFHGGDGGI